MALDALVTVRKFPNMKESVTFQPGMTVIDAVKQSGLDFANCEFRLNKEKNVNGDRAIAAGDKIYLLKASVGA